MQIGKKIYDKSNYMDLGVDISTYLKNYFKKKYTEKKISKKVIASLDLPKYIEYAQKVKNYYEGTVNRNSIQMDTNTDYHPYYFLEKNDDEVIIVFKQTSEYNDIVLDLKHYKQFLNNILKTHIKIISKILFYYGLIEHIQEYEGKKVTIIGSSLGAVLGAYLLLILKIIDRKKYGIENIKLKMYSFGCPICIPEVLQKYISKHIIAVVNERDPIVCFRGSNSTILYTVGGNKIYNFVTDPKTKKVNCYQRNCKYFVNNGLFFLFNNSLSTHRLSSLEKNIECFLTNSRK